MPKPNQKSKKLPWTRDSDANGNPYWEALSPFSSDGESADLYWRIRRNLVESPSRVAKHLYFADSDAECPHVSVTGTLPQVKAAIQEKHNTILESVKLEQEAKSEHRYNLNINNS